MQILPIGRTNNNFSGRYLNIKQIQHDTTYTPEYDDHDYAIYSLINDNGKYEVTDDKGVQLAKERSHAEAIKKCGGYYFYNSSIEFNRWGDKGKVYFADPNEGITEDILRNAGIIVKDNEPSYPDVHKEVSLAYFGNSRENFAQHWTTVSEYFKRVEKADLETLKNVSPSDKSKMDYYIGRVKYARKQQEICSTCTDIYNKSKDLRDRKNSLEDVNTRLIFKYNNSINYDEGRKLQEEIRANNLEIAEIKKSLIPHFDELKNYYAKEHIKVIKNI